MSRIVRPGAVSLAKGEEEARPGDNHPRQGDTDPYPLWVSHGQQQILDRLRAAVLAGPGVLVLTGDVGTGKTFLARALLHQLRADAIIATPMYARDDPKDFWREVGRGWGIQGAPNTLEALYDGLTALLAGAAAGDKRVLLFIDEAQGLSRDLFAEIGRLAVMAGEPRSPARLSILLVGQDELATVLSRPENAELAKRVGVRCVTEPLTEAEVHEYIVHQLARDGREGAVFTGDGLRELAIASQGIPRLINTIVGLALLSRGREGTAIIGAEVVRGCVRPLERSPGRVDRPQPPRATPTIRMARPRRDRRGWLYVSALALLTALAVYVYEVAWRREATREVNPNARPAAALVPAPTVSSGSATPAEPSRVSEPGPAVAAVPGPPEGSVPRPVDPSAIARPAAPPGGAARVSEPGPAVAAVPGPPEGSVQPAPVPVAPIRPLPRPAAEGTTALSENTAGAAPAARIQVVTAPTSSGARRPPEVQPREESERIDPGSIIDWLLSEYPARRQ
jgi:general secretion pathway protein A